jgi:hypothetical protein
MLHANLVSVFLQMQNSAASEARASTPQATLRFPQLSIGQAVTAAIVSRLGPELYLARIEGQPVQLSLPAALVPGGTISLRLLRIEPDYTFQLLPRDAPAVPAVPATTSLTQGAQIIHSVLADPATDLRAVAKPLLPAPPVNALAETSEQLASSLRGAISNSGLFYESHLAAWSQGRVPLASIRAEPQNSLPVQGAPGHAANDPHVLPDIVARSDGNALPDEVRPILRHQLDAMETHALNWQGPVWPNQTASLTICEDPPASKQDPVETTWRTTLRLELPHLGNLRIDLASCGKSVSASIAAVSDAAARALQTGLPSLDDRLRTADIRPAQITVANHG